MVIMGTPPRGFKYKHKMIVRRLLNLHDIRDWADFLSDE
jgi:hypothetical protein